MNTVKYNKGGKLKVSQKSVEVPPPSGYHWTQEGGRYKKGKPYPENLEALMKERDAL